jgi:hypothetical protein
VDFDGDSATLEDNYVGTASGPVSILSKAAVGTDAGGGALLQRIATVIQAGSYATINGSEMSFWTVSFDKTSGSGTAPTALMGASVTLPPVSDMTPPTDKIFWCWNTDTNGTGTSYRAGASYEPTQNTTLYAKWTGDGLANTKPTEVGIQAELAAIANGLSRHYKLANDITITDWATLDGQFTGTFDGNGKTITFSGTVTANSNSYAGLFGGISGGKVKNMGIAGEISVNSSSDVYVGAVAGNVINCTAHLGIWNVKSTATINVTTSSGNIHVGGIVGKIGTSSIIYNCYTTSQVKGNGTGIVQSGGIVSSISQSGVYNCYAKGEVSAIGSTTYAGGIVAYAYQFNLNNNIALNTSISGSTTANTGRIMGNSSSGYVNNWAITIAGLSSGAHNNKDGAQFNNATTKSSWTATAQSAGPGWTIADDAAAAKAAYEADTSNGSPWWWNVDHPALFWE